MYRTVLIMVLKLMKNDINQSYYKSMLLKNMKKMTKKLKTLKKDVTKIFENTTIADRRTVSQSENSH